jgi:hypothetical protein
MESDDAVSQFARPVVVVLARMRAERRAISPADSRRVGLYPRGGVEFRGRTMADNGDGLGEVSTGWRLYVARDSVLAFLADGTERRSWRSQ